MGAKREVVLDGRISPARRRRLNHVSGNGKAALYRHHVATKPPGAIHYSSLSRLDRPYDTARWGSIPSVRGGLDAPPHRAVSLKRLAPYDCGRRRLMWGALLRWRDSGDINPILRKTWRV